VNLAPGSQALPTVLLLDVMFLAVLAHLSVNLLNQLLHILHVVIAVEHSVHLATLVIDQCEGPPHDENSGGKPVS
jgi:hypothetical protein